MKKILAGALFALVASVSTMRSAETVRLTFLNKSGGGIEFTACTAEKKCSAGGGEYYFLFTGGTATINIPKEATHLKIKLPNDAVARYFPGDKKAKEISSFTVAINKEFELSLQ